MKLDKIKFARLIAYIGRQYAISMSMREMEDIDELCDIDVTPVEVPGKADPVTINELMRAIHANEKISAIKAYRTLTGYGLKEAKDAVEAGWVDKRVESTEIKRTKQELYGRLNIWSDEKSLTPAQDNAISSFINYAF